VNQRWLFGRDSYRPPAEVIATREYEVSAIGRYQDARQFVLDHHYSGTYPAARFCFGLYRHAKLSGVAVFSHPVSDLTLTGVFKAPAIAGVELGRFILLDEVPGNGETWFLARCFEHLRREGIVGVVSFSDPTARTNVHGETVFAGHIGTIYQAANGRYLGRSAPRSLHILPDGQVLSSRALQKIRSGSQGWRYAASLIEAHGAAPIDFERRREWLATWLPKITRRARHFGNHKYAWPLDRSQRFLKGGPYPKTGRAA
jgi:hypothetical protein